ncbi:hypothetical protein VTK73DRAFT_4635 [Phialemonium thermophilum]|uniref:cyclic pyranopterin monophosphate synthase n=1 Tax=Phialemonium thermophilum TaxID=223376 RepID=A0ABR3WSG0_9PEZI
MVSIADKAPTKRVATATCSVLFQDPRVTELIRTNRTRKGDVLAVARVAGIMAAKRTPDLIPLCHPIALSQVRIDLDVRGPDAEEGGQEGGGRGRAGDGSGGVSDRHRVDITATVSCEGKTGVEMEALMAASTAALTVYDMCKAVDKAMVIDGLRVVLKEGGKSGRWVQGVHAPT